MEIFGGEVMKDELLIRKAKKGDKDALLNLVMEEKDDLYRLAYSYMKNEADAMNSLQDMIVKLYENIGNLKDTSKFYSWSKTILVNLCKDDLKKRKRVILIDDMEYMDDPRLEDKDSSLIVGEILNSLDLIYREVINLHYILGYDYESIGEILGIPLGTVKSRIHNGKKKLEKILKEGDGYVG